MSGAMGELCFEVADREALAKLDDILRWTEDMAKYGMPGVSDELILTCLQRLSAEVIRLRRLKRDRVPTISRALRIAGLRNPRWWRTNCSAAIALATEVRRLRVLTARKREQRP